MLPLKPASLAPADVHLETTLAEGTGTRPALATPAYSPRALQLVFLWLLGGDFAFAFFEQIFGKFIPLFAADLHASNTVIGLMTGSFAGLANLFVLPFVSLRSDRHRGRWGRRIPFLLCATPCAVGSLILVGFAPEIGATVHAWTAGWITIAEGDLSIGLLCAFVVSYHLWNMVLVNAYNWLIRDVVPEKVQGRFVSWMRIITTIASVVFLYEVFPHLLTNRREIFVAVGGVYTAAFLLMCCRVKEPRYPPPAPKPTRWFHTFGKYFRECLTVPMYRHYFIVYVLIVIAIAGAAPFTTILSRDRLELSMAELAKVNTLSTLVSAATLVPVGWACDRFRPIRVAIGAVVAYALISLGAFLFVHDRQGWWIYSLVNAIPAAVWPVGSATMTMELFPARQFGQFSGGLNVFGYGGLVVGNYAMGAFMDYSHSRYELAFVWSAALFALALIPLALVYQGWKEHGGPHGYVAPLPPGSMLA